MITSKPVVEKSHQYVDEAADSADHAIRATQRVTNDALNSLSSSVKEIRNRSSEQIGALAQRGMDVMRDGSQQLRDKAVHASDATVGYIKDEPVKAMLIAAAAGAALMAVIALLTRPRGHR